MESVLKPSVLLANVYTSLEKFKPGPSQGYICTLSSEHEGY